MKPHIQGSNCIADLVLIVCVTLPISNIRVAVTEVPPSDSVPYHMLEWGWNLLQSRVSDKLDR